MTALLLLIALQDPAPAVAAQTAWFPQGFLYRHPLADPRAPVTAVRMQFPLHQEDAIRIEAVLASQFSVFRWTDPDHGFEIQAEGGAFARFDPTEEYDMDGVDFRFGFPIVYRNGNVAFKLHPFHVTSHLGDELIERTHRDIIIYARNEIAAGISWDVSPQFRVYAEGGRLFEGAGANEPARFMLGFDSIGCRLGEDWPEAFAGLNLTTFQETGWGVSLNVECGFWLHPEGSDRGARIGIGYFRGPSPLTQFQQENEEFMTVGVSLPF